MVFEEDLEDLYYAFGDRLEHDGKEQKIIICKICCLESLSHSTRSNICEMCFETDFWEHQETLVESAVAYMWAIKVTKSGLLGRAYFRKGGYWVDRHANSTSSLNSARLYKTKEPAEQMLRIVDRVISSKNRPEFTIVQIRLQEV
jgi:hypothetical protein